MHKEVKQNPVQREKFSRLHTVKSFVMYVYVILRLEFTLIQQACVTERSCLDELNSHPSSCAYSY